MLEQFLPHPPGKGPPIPHGIFPKWPWVIDNPGNPVAKPTIHDTAHDAEIDEMTKQEKPVEDDYVIVLKKKNPNPIWLKEHQKRLAEASKKASELTKHLKGEKRVRARHDIISRILKGNA